MIAESRKDNLEDKTIKNRLFIFSLIVFAFLQASCNHKNTQSTSKASNQTPVSRKINIVIFENFSPQTAEPWIKEMKNIFSKVEIIRTNEKLPANAWYEPRKRYLANKILDYMITFTPDGCISLGMTTKDISVKKGEIPNWGIMGLSYQGGNASVISTFRLKPNEIKDDGIKLCLHELAHSEGLPHCPASDCILRDAKGGNHFDEQPSFCKDCSEYLIKKGWNSKSKYLKGSSI